MLLDTIQFNYLENNNQKNLFTNYHKRYRCKISYMGKQFAFDYQCNPQYTMPNKKDCINAIISDMEAYDYNEVLENFMWEYGYENKSEAQKVFNACKNTSMKLHKIFSFDELDTLAEETRD